MNVYNLKNIENCYVCGNIDRNLDRFINSITSNLSHFKKKEHKKEIERQERLKARANENAMMLRGMNMGRGHRVQAMQEPHPMKKMKSSYMMGLGSCYDNSAIIVSGNCGIGTKSKKYYEELFSGLDKVLAANNCYLFFVRGNNDDPSYFENKVIDFEHVKTLPDYSVVVFKTYNCLCIGGSVSIDKEWKLSQEELFGRKMFWENEAPNFDEEKLTEILKEFRISFVVSSTAPSFVYPGTNAFKRSKWFSNDKTVLKEFTKERKTIDKVYEHIMDSESKPYMWFYGRFKMGHQDKINDILFSSIAPYQMMQVNNLLMAFFSIDPSKELGVNDHTFDGLFEEYKKEKGISSGLLRGINYHDVINELDAPRMEEPQEDEFLDEILEGEEDGDIDAGDEEVREDDGRENDAPVGAEEILRQWHVDLAATHQEQAADLTNVRINARTPTADDLRWEINPFAANNIVQTTR